MRLPPRLPAAVGLGTVFVALAVGGPWWPTAAGIGLLLLLLAGVAPTAGRSPFVRWQLVRAARRGRPFLSRVLIAGVGLFVAVVFLLSYRTLKPDPTADIDPLAAPARQAVELAHAVLLGLVGLLALVFAGRAAFALPGVIAEEREANRLDHLLVTDLRTGEILLGRTIGVAAPMAAEVLVPLPLLVLLAAYSGASPEALAVAGVLVGGLTVGTLGVAVGCSAGARTIARAVGRTLAALTGLFVGTLVLSVLAAWLAGWLGIPGRWLPWLYCVCDTLAAGNPVVFLQNVYAAGATSALTDMTARHYMAWHVAVLGFGWWWAARRLRPPAVRRPVPAVRAAVQHRRTYRIRPRWWMVPLGVVVAMFAVWQYDRRLLVWLVELLFRLSGPLAFVCVTVPAGWAAARRLPLERQSNTLDSLLLTALTPGQIVRRAWRQGLRAVSGPAAVLMVLFALPVAVSLYEWAVAGRGRIGPEGGRSLAGLLLLPLSIATDTALAAAIGVLVSVPAASTRRATAALLLVSLYWTAGWIGWWIVSDSSWSGWALHVFVPVIAQTRLGALVFYLPPRWTPEEVELLWHTVLSAVGAAVLLFAACVWFRRRVRPTPEVPA